LHIQKIEFSYMHIQKMILNRSMSSLITSTSVFNSYVLTREEGIRFMNQLREKEKRIRMSIWQEMYYMGCRIKNY